MSSPTAPFWVSAFLDLAPDHHAEGLLFWSVLTGYPVSAPRGAGEEFATLLPAHGDAYLRAQRLGTGPGRIHLDLHVADPRAAADHAITLGAAEVVDHPQWHYVVMASPAGVPFCFVSHPATERPEATRWGGHTSRLDQVCLDVPPASYRTEVGFWSALTGWQTRASPVSEGFTSLVRPSGQPLRFLLQRLDGAGDVPGAHLDWATDDRAEEVARHRALGAEVVAEHPVWTVLRDPVGRVYCVTDRDPATGVLR
ncbi:VOC family protein [Nocardioides sambongensis]|uniref:VOC family protein n=1 Tax=Nocardioides sambongensis TaxID=2589074 RepID=UPI00112CEB6C|nr:VOC family protein [Nocardioides sambongensis]